jgi:diguanylate cyclase (GGDEF)-like protein
MALLREALSTGLDGVLLCEISEPFVVGFVSEPARTVLVSLGVPAAVFDRVSRGRAQSPPRDPVSLFEVLPAGLDADESVIAQEAIEANSRVFDVIDVRGPEGTIRGHLEVAVRRVDQVLIWSIRLIQAEDRQADRPIPQASVDALTGLTSRAAVRRAVELCQQRLDFLGEGFALALLDIDDLAGVNERLGHDVGDIVLREVGERMRGLVRGSDVVGRVGDDEFVLVWPGVRSHTDVRMLHRRVVESMSAEFEINGSMVGVTMSAGAVFVSAPQGCDADDLLRDADAAMRKARSKGPGSLVVYEHRENLDRSSTFVTAGELREALRQGEFVLYSQPIVDVFTGTTAGAEMLVRWRHPQRGLLGPSEFLLAAEVTDVMDQIGEWVIDRTVAVAAGWERLAPLGGYRISINAWPRQLTHSDLVGQLEKSLERHGSTPQRFVVEVLESQELQSRTRVAEQLRRLLDLGVGVGIDDFGSGFANMSYLRDLPIDMIKVDRALVGRYPTRREEAILEAIQLIGSAIEADVVLEGVEQIAQLEAARRCGVRLAQGYLVGRPVLVGHTPPKGKFPLPPADPPVRKAALA